MFKSSYETNAYAELTPTPKNDRNLCRAVCNMVQGVFASVAADSYARAV
jgi:hypothetical protein